MATAVQTNECDLAAAAMLLPVEAFVSPAYARAEKDNLWVKVWHVACREEDIPSVGDYFTHEIADQSLIVVRKSDDEIAAYFNVCLHRGRRLTAGCGSAARFVCKYHGWQWDLEGRNVVVRDEGDWAGSLCSQDVPLPEAKVGRWGGFVFVNMDPDCEPLEEFLGEVPNWLDPFELGKMRYGWRKWGTLACNWKVFIEAFIEGYHAETTHPQFFRFTMGDTYSRTHGRHSSMQLRAAAGGGLGTGLDPARSGDMRQFMKGSIHQLWDTTGSMTTATFVSAVDQMAEILPETATIEECVAKMMEIAHQIDSERGVTWPVVDPGHMSEVGVVWHVFPNLVILPNLSYTMVFRAKPNGFDPDSCIFEVFHLERFPEGKEPKPENEYVAGHGEADWRLLIAQDISNLVEVQKGLHSLGLPFLRPNPAEETTVLNLHRNLAEFMGTGAPVPASS